MADALLDFTTNGLINTGANAFCLTSIANINKTTTVFFRGIHYRSSAPQTITGNYDFYAIRIA